MPRTLVTGATGFLGGHVTGLLVERGDEVRALVRPASDLRPLEGLELETVRGQVGDRRAVRRALRGVDRVFHLAGSTNLRLSREASVAVNVEGTRVVLEEALRAGVERVVHTSSVVAIGPARKGSVATEANVWDAGRYGIPYVDAKRRAEEVALADLPNAACRWSWSIRPTCWVPATGAVPRPCWSGASCAGRSPPTWTGRSTSWASRTSPGGTCSPPSEGCPASATSSATAISRWTGCSTTWAACPGSSRRRSSCRCTVALAMARAGRPLAGGSIAEPAEIRAASLRWAFSSAKAKRELGWRTSPHEDCLEETIVWYREQEGDRLAPPGSRQPVALRLAGAFARRSPLGWM